MKTLLILLALSSVTLKADDSDGPCAQVKSACRAAGFSDSKALWKSCIEPLFKGEKVAGVTLDEDIVKMCKMKYPRAGK